MDNFKGLMKKVKTPELKMMASKPALGTNIRALKKELEDCKNERMKQYGFIGMEAYDLWKSHKLEIPELISYMEKMDQMNQTIEELEANIKELENKNTKKNTCSCGYKLKAQDRFCPNCGEEVLRDTLICVCGAEIEKELKFCRSCGKSMEEIVSLLEEAKKPSMRECICGAKVPQGQFMCLDCGRKME